MTAVVTNADLDADPEVCPFLRTGKGLASLRRPMAIPETTGNPTRQADRYGLRVTQMTPGDRTYRNQLVRLTDLTVTDDVISEVTFENCTLVGPAVIVLLNGGTMSHLTIDAAGPEAFFWPLGIRQAITGAIALDNCTLVGCRLQRIGLAYTDEQEPLIRAGFNLH